MKKIITCICLLLCYSAVIAQNSTGKRSIPFDAGWSFIKDNIPGAQETNYDDSKWRTVNLPHDWSIEDLPNQTADSITGPFSRNSIGQYATGFSVGGTGWYRKKFYYH